MSRVTYDMVWTRRTHVAPCPVCGKRTTRSRVFRQTVSPFNPAVAPGMSDWLAYEAVEAAVEAEADAWQPDHRHATCIPGLIFNNPDD